jgi:hypothetical protein
VSQAVFDQDAFYAFRTFERLLHTSQPSSRVEDLAIPMSLQFHATKPAGEARP